MSGRLQDKVALITGAGSGIGRETSLLFAAEGARVLAVDLNRDSVEETVEKVKAAGGEVTSQIADVSSPEDSEAMGSAQAQRCNVRAESADMACGLLGSLRC